MRWTKTKAKIEGKRDRPGLELLNRFRRRTAGGRGFDPGRVVVGGRGRKLDGKVGLDLTSLTYFSETNVENAEWPHF